MASTDSTLASGECASDALAAPVWDGPPQWVLGDLHPGNLIVDRGRLSAVVDFGDLCGGDPACDLGVASMMLDASARAVVFEHADVGRADIRRGRGWAMAWAIAVGSFSADNARYAAVARRTLEAVMEDDLS